MRTKERIIRCARCKEELDKDDYDWHEQNKKRLCHECYLQFLDEQGGEFDELYQNLDKSLKKIKRGVRNLRSTR